MGDLRADWHIFLVSYFPEVTVKSGCFTFEIFTLSWPTYQSLFLFQCWILSNSLKFEDKTTKKLLLSCPELWTHTLGAWVVGEASLKNLWEVQISV